MGLVEFRIQVSWFVGLGIYLNPEITYPLFRTQIPGNHDQELEKTVGCVGFR